MTDSQFVPYLVVRLPPLSTPGKIKIRRGRDVNFIPDYGYLASWWWSCSLPHQWLTGSLWAVWDGVTEVRHPPDPVVRIVGIDPERGVVGAHRNSRGDWLHSWFEAADEAFIHWRKHHQPSEAA